MSLPEVLAVIVALTVTVPITVYLSVKLGTFAFYRARQLSETENREATTSHPEE